jgi:uncharacterized protein (TIGR02145 family)
MKQLALFFIFFIAANLIAQQKGTFTDPRDGKIYKTVKIGKQTWMAENLNFNVGSGSWCYDNSISNCASYGRLYTWDAARSACPSGWHLPNDSEWNQLINYLGGENVAGGKLKSTIHWNSPNIEATNSSGFSAFPGGSRGDSGGFFGLGYNGAWWSSAGGTSTGASCRTMLYDDGRVYRGGGSKAHSVRCLRD